MSHVLITGGSSGLGAALARELAARGHALSLLARREARLVEVAAGLDTATHVAVADVTDRQGLHAAIDGCVRANGPVDICIANAGGGKPTPAVSLDGGQAARMLRLNVEGVLYTFEAVIPAMVERGDGQLVTIASLAGLVGMPEAGVYSACKAAVQAMSQSLRTELSPLGIAVTTVNPGFIRTPAHDGAELPFMLDADDAARRIVRGIAARRRVVEFPWQLSWALRGARWGLPGAWLEAALARLPR